MRLLPARRPRPRKPFARPFLLERLETRLTPTAGFGYAFALGSTSYDYVSAEATDSAGDVYVAGSFTGDVDFDPGSNYHVLTSLSKYENFLAKYAPDGSLLWAGSLDSTDSVFNNPIDLAVGTDGSLYVTGNVAGTTDFDLGSGVSSLTANGPRTAFVASYSPNGSLNWVHSLADGSANVVASKIAVDPSGNVYSIGTLSNGSADFDPGSGTFILTSSTSNVDTYISKLDSSGNFVWAGLLACQPSGTSWISTSALAVDDSQNIYLTGSFDGTVDFNPGSGTLLKSSASQNAAAPPYGDAFVARITPTGDVGYVVSMGSSQAQDSGTSIALDTSGNAYVSGHFVDTMTILAPDGTPATSLTSAGQQDASIIKLDPSGQLLWAKSLGSTGLDQAEAIALDGSTLDVSGTYTGLVDFNPGPGSAPMTSLPPFAYRHDAFVLQLDTSGQYLSAEDIGPQLVGTSNIAPDAQGNLFLTGSFSGTKAIVPGDPTATITNAPQSPSYVTDGYVLKINPSQIDFSPPTAADTSVSTSQNTPLSIPLSALVAAGSPPASNPLAFYVTSTNHGAVSQNADGSLTYTPNSSYTGTDSFSYQLRSGWAYSNPATVSVQISPNHPPVAANDQYALPINATYTVPVVQGVLSNDTDADGNPLSAILDSSPAHGTLKLNSDGSFTYTPSPGFSGPDSFTYLANDGQADSAPATVSLYVTAPPVPTLQSLSVSAGNSLSLSLSATDNSTPTSQLIYQITSLPTLGTLSNGTTPLQVGDTFTGSPTLTYHASHHVGTDSFQFSVSDSLNAPIPAQITLSVHDSTAHRTAQPGDYDGDGRADFVTYTPSNFVFHILPSSTGKAYDIQYGWPGRDVVISGDFDGDGHTDVATFTPSTSTFHIIPSSTGKAYDIQYGTPASDIPIPADFDGDGRTDIATYTASTSTFHIIPSSTGHAYDIQYGTPGSDLPIPGDYDGDGRTDIATFTPSSSTFHIIPSSTGKAYDVQYGYPGHDTPIPGDYDGDGRTDIATYRSSDSTFHILPSSTGHAYDVALGHSGDIPIPADYTNNGTTDLAVYTPSTSTFLVLSASSGKPTTTQYGWPGHDQPVSLPIAMKVQNILNRLKPGSLS